MDRVGVNAWMPVAIRGPGQIVQRRPRKCLAVTMISSVMSKGLGKIQKQVLEAFLAAPNGSYGVMELAAIAYPGQEIGHSHKVAVLRAADAVCSQTGWVKTKRRRVVRYCNPTLAANEKALKSAAYEQLKNL